MILTDPAVLILARGPKRRQSLRATKTSALRLVTENNNLPCFQPSLPYGQRPTVVTVRSCLNSPSLDDRTEKF